MGRRVAAIKAAHLPAGHPPPSGHAQDLDDRVHLLLAGRITLVVDHGEVDLQPFDVAVQRGSNHSWINRGVENALLMAVLVDAGLGG